MLACEQDRLCEFGENFGPLASLISLKGETVCVQTGAQVREGKGRRCFPQFLPPYIHMYGNDYDYYYLSNASI